MQLLDPATIRIIRQDVNRTGPANCWTGTSGTLAAHCRRLMDERAELLAMVQQGDCDSPRAFFAGMITASVLSIPIWMVVYSLLVR